MHGADFDLKVFRGLGREDRLAPNDLASGRFATRERRSLIGSLLDRTAFHAGEGVKENQRLPAAIAAWRSCSGVSVDFPAFAGVP